MLSIFSESPATFFPIRKGPEELQTHLEKGPWLRLWALPMGPQLWRRAPQPGLGWRGKELPIRSLSFLYPAGHYRVSTDPGPLERSRGLQLCSQGTVGHGGQEAGNVESASSF